MAAIAVRMLRVWLAVTENRAPARRAVAAISAV
jgi:hypothetical protein